MNSSDGSADASVNVTTEGRIAQDFLSQVGTRIRALRQERSLTMQQLADRSQISRRLLTQIEYGQANPSLVTITQIARQLGTDFTTLLDDAHGTDSPVEVFGPGEQVLVWSSDRGSTARLLVSTRGARTADMWLWRLEPGDSYQGNADPDRSQELFHVVEGALTVRTDGAEVAVPQGSSSRLRSDRPYSYANEGNVVTVFLRTVALGS